MNDPGVEGDLSEVDRDPFEVVAESFLARYRAGERPSINDFAARYPELAEQIRELLPALVMVEQDLTVDRGSEPGFALSHAAALAAGKGQLGDYRLLREVGRGGMGVVYEAEQGSLGRRVALKVLPGHVSGDRKALERFRREAKAAARLHHTNIVPIFEVGQCDDVAYYAMQFIQGQALDQVIEELRRLDDAFARPTRGGRPGAGSRARPGVIDPPTRNMATGARDRPPGQVAQWLQNSRLATRGPGAFADDPVPDAARSTLFDPAELTSAESRAARQPPRAASPTTDVSASAVLPGGTAVSMVSSSARRQPFFRSVAQIGRQAAQGLAHAHARGIVHRDIKPSNLLLDTAGVVWIADFGLAKSEDDGLTATGDVLGTLRYMAPERFRGDGDARADIYALGLTLYELMTLRPAYNSPDRLALIDQIQNEEPARPRTLDDRIPRDLETIILKAIDKEPARRYTTAEAMAEDLRRFLGDEPIQARRASLAERYARWARHHRTIAVLGAVLAVVLVLSTAASLVVAGLMSDLAAKERKAAIAERAAREVAGQRATAEALAHAEAETARTAAVAETYRATLSEVKALRAGREPGWREEALGDLTRLATMPTPRRDLPELRTEATATLGTPDIRLAARIELPLNELISFAFSRDGRTLATADGNKGLDFWDIPGLRHVSSADQLAMNGATTDGAVYLPGGQGLAVSTGDHGVVFTDAQGLRTSRPPITQGSSRPTKLEISADGRRLAVAWADGLGVTIHDLASGSVLKRFANGLFAFSPDGRWIAREENAEIVLLPVDPGGSRVVLGHHGGTNALAFSPDGSMLAVAFADHTTVLWDVASREQFGTLRGHRERVHDVAFSPDGEWIATTSLDYTTRIWERRTVQNIATLPAFGAVYKVRWSPAGDFLATSTHSSREVFLYAVVGRHRVQQWLAGHRVELGRVAAHPRREQFATSGYTELNAWEFDGPRPSPVPLERNSGSVTALTYNTDGSLLAIGCWRDAEFREILIRDTKTWQVRARIPVPQIVWALAFDPTGERIAIGDNTGAILLWDLATNRKIRQFETGSRINSIEFLEDPPRLAAHGRDAVDLFDLEADRAERAELAGGVECFVTDLARGRLLVGCRNGAIGSLSLADLTPGPRLEHAHDSAVTCMALSPDGRLLVTGGDDHRIVLWDALSFEPLLNFPTWAGTLRDLAFDFRGRRLAIVGTNCDVELWDLAELREGLAGVGLAWDQPANAAAPPVGPAADGEHRRPAVPTIRRPDQVTDPSAFERARSLVQSGVGAFENGRWAGAIRDFQQARAHLAILHRASPGDAQVAGQLGVCLGFLGAALRNERRPAEALAVLDEARQVLEALRKPSSTDLYNLACAYAGLSAGAEPGPVTPASVEREVFAERAMESLRRSLAAGMSDFALMDRDHDLDPLRDRPDFRALVLDRGFPADPFVEPSPLRSLDVEDASAAEAARLSAAISQRPADYAVFAARGHFYARYRGWPRSAADFRKAIELHPPQSWADRNDDTWFGYVAGMALLQANDRDGHRLIARAMLDKFADSDNSFTRDRTAKINLFADPPAADLRTIGELADRSVRLGEGKAGLCWLQLTRGMASYRSGDFAAAVGWLQRAEGSGLDDLSRVVARFYLAMAEYRLGHGEQARALYNRAGDPARAELQAADWGDRWLSVAEADLTRREAEALIFGTNGQPDEAPGQPR